MLKEFKDFAIKGNVIDLAVAVIIGAAFGKIIASLVNDVLMPVIGALLGGLSFADLKIIITPAVGETAEVAVLYGAFLQAILDFIIIAFCVFLIVRTIAKAKKKSAAAAPPAPVAPPAPPADVVLLEEIRDLLKSRS